MAHEQLKEELKDGMAETLKVAEGFRRHAYKDHLGFLTIGYGRLIDERRGGGIAEDEAEMLLENDIESKYSDLLRDLPWVSDQPEPVIRALINMTFQMGAGGLLTFRNMLAAIQEGRYQDAAVEGLNSRWAVQTPNRAKRVTDLIASVA